MGGRPEREIMQGSQKEIKQKETGKKKIKYAKKLRTALLLAGAVLLVGCTRKEELLVLDEEIVAEEEQPEISEEETAKEESGTETAGENTQGGVPLQEENSPGVICVHVCGAVARPGVYELQAGSRVYEAVQAAGGFTGQAEQNYVNQAQVLPDGVKLVIPTAEEVAAVEEAEAGKVEAGEAEASAAGTKEDAAQIQAGIVAEEAGGKLQAGIVAETLPGEAGSGKNAQPEDGKININTASEEQLCGIPGIGATRAAAIAAYRDSHGGFKKPEDIMQVSGIKEGMYEKIKDSICVN